MIFSRRSGKEGTEINNTAQNIEIYQRLLASCGIITMTCDEHPRITYINDEMLSILRSPDGTTGSELIGNDVFLIIPIEERLRLTNILSRAKNSSSPLHGEISALRYDGTKVRLFGVISKAKYDDGSELFECMCIDITEKYSLRKKKENALYLNVLKEVYDKIFECDISRKTLTCLYGQNPGIFQNIENIPMQLEEAAEHWVETSVADEDKAAVRSFISAGINGELHSTDEKAPRIEFSAVSSDGSIRKYLAAYIETDSSSGLFCYRRATGDRSENTSAHDNDKKVHELVMQTKNGIVAFEVEDARVRPLYASENVRGFFGYTKEEWEKLASSSHSLKDFVSRSGIAYSEFIKIFEKGEAEFEYTDLQKNAIRKIKAVCSNMDDDSSPRYITLHDTAEESSNPAARSRIYIRTFGYFDVFIDDKPIAFRNEKSKELFALLVNRRGGYVSSEEAITILWEDEPINSVTLARYRKVALRLKNILAEYGISDIVESVNGQRRIVTEKVRCDLYDYLSEKEEYSHLFKGSYLTNYSWGEATLAELMN